MEEGAKIIGWKDRKKPGEWVGVKKRGIGMATVVHISGCKGNLYSEHSSAFVKVNEDGSVHLITGLTDHGQGNHTVLGMIAAEELGIPFEDINIMAYPAVDTDS